MKKPYVRPVIVVNEFQIGWHVSVGSKVVNNDEEKEDNENEDPRSTKIFTDFDWEQTDGLWGN